MLCLYDYWESGNAYKVRLLLCQLGEPFERIHLDILRGETRQREFLAKNPNRRRAAFGTSPTSSKKTARPFPERWNAFTTPSA